MEPLDHETCPNCESPSPGRFCPECGQDNVRRRLALRPMLLETAQTALGWESSLGRTLRGLFLAPGEMVADYVAGRRRRYVNPARFALLALALWFLAIGLSGMDVLEASGINVTSKDSAPGSERFTFVQEIRTFLGSNLQILLYLTLPLEALFLRLAFRSSGRNLAENMVLVLYLAGFGYLLGIASTPLLALGWNAVRPVKALLGFVWFVRTVRRFHDRGLWASLLLSLLVATAHTLATFLVFGLIAVPVVLLRTG